jgi:hypothetical protein
MIPNIREVLHIETLNHKVQRSYFQVFCSILLSFLIYSHISEMGISYSTAKWVAPLSFVVDFAAQQYGMLSTPNMKDIHDANLSFWSPQPYFIAGFFFPQQLFQLAWLYRLYKLDANKSVEEKKELDTMVDFVPYYAVGNICIACEFHICASWRFCCS